MCHIYLYIINLLNRIKDNIYNRLNKIQIQIDFLIKSHLVFVQLKKTYNNFWNFNFSSKRLMSRLNKV